MDLIKELEGYNSQLDAWKKGHGWSNKESLQEVVEIWERWQEEKKEQIYGNLNHNVIPTDVGCSSCVSDALSLLYNWREIERPKVKTVSYKAIKEKVEVIEPTVDVDRMKDKYNADAGIGKINIDESKCVQDLEDTWVDIPDSIEAIVDKDNKELSKEDKITHLQQECREKGIKFHHKAGVKKLTELLGRGE